MGKEVGPLTWIVDLGGGKNLQLRLHRGRMEGECSLSVKEEGLWKPELYSNARQQEIDDKVAEQWGRLHLVADKYCVRDLAYICEEALVNSLDEYNAATH